MRRDLFKPSGWLVLLLISAVLSGWWAAPAPAMTEPLAINGIFSRSLTPSPDLPGSLVPGPVTDSGLQLAKGPVKEDYHPHEGETPESARLKSEGLKAQSQPDPGEAGPLDATQTTPSSGTTALTPAASEKPTQPHPLPKVGDIPPLVSTP